MKLLELLSALGVDHAVIPLKRLASLLPHALADTRAMDTELAALTLAADKG